MAESNAESRRFEVAIEAVKQQLTLSTALFAFVATFGEKLGDTPRAVSIVVSTLALSIICGVAVLLTVPYALYDKGDPFSNRSVRVAGSLQSLLFLLGIIEIVFFVGVR